jgi:hypothetical protein
MTACTGELFAAIDARRGITIRTAATLKDLITELMLNSGEEIAMWIEGEAKRCADIWRSQIEQEDRTERARAEAEENETGEMRCPPRE